jgi:hypothetical protein
MKNNNNNNTDKSSESSKNNKFSHNVEVKGKYLGGKQSRTLEIDPQFNKVYLYEDGSEKRKEFDLDKIKYTQ